MEPEALLLIAGVVLLIVGVILYILLNGIWNIFLAITYFVFVVSLGTFLANRD